MLHHNSKSTTSSGQTGLILRIQKHDILLQSPIWTDYGHESRVDFGLQRCRGFGLGPWDRGGGRYFLLVEIIMLHSRMQNIFLGFWIVRKLNNQPTEQMVSPLQKNVNYIELCGFMSMIK